jgi:hypothetical protein
LELARLPICADAHVPWRGEHAVFQRFLTLVSSPPIWIVG